MPRGVDFDMALHLRIGLSSMQLHKFHLQETLWGPGQRLHRVDKDFVGASKDEFFWAAPNFAEAAVFGWKRPSRAGSNHSATASPASTKTDLPFYRKRTVTKLHQCRCKQKSHVRSSQRPCRCKCTYCCKRILTWGPGTADKPLLQGCTESLLLLPRNGLHMDIMLERILYIEFILYHKLCSLCKIVKKFWYFMMY